MVAISFTVFKDKIKSGEKTQTIRPFSRKRLQQMHGIQKLQLYWKQRMPSESEKLHDARFVEGFLIEFDEYGYPYWAKSVWSKYGLCREDKVVIPHPYVFGEKSIRMENEELCDLAARDGFDSVPDFQKFFVEKYGDNLYNMLFMVIRWENVD